MPQLARQTDTSLSEINIVPFVDVVLVLLVIFMITAPILQSGTSNGEHTVEILAERHHRQDMSCSSLRISCRASRSGGTSFAWSLGHDSPIRGTESS